MAKALSMSRTAIIAGGERIEENETFNTLKNQGYHSEHNYGPGKKNLHGFSDAQVSCFPGGSDPADVLSLSSRQKEGRLQAKSLGKDLEESFASLLSNPWRCSID